MKNLFLLAGTALAVRALVRTRRRIDLNDKVVLITGGARGLGLETARVASERGALLALVSRDQDQLDRAQAELGGRVFTRVCDVTERLQVEEMVAEVLDHYGRIDVLINNAGVIEGGPMEEMTLADYDEAMQTHFWAPLYCIETVLPEMRARSSGRIVNIASIGGKISVPHLLPYSASKFALVGLSEGLRAELMKAGILVTTVCPGLMRTGSHLNAKFKGQHRKEFALFSLSASLPFTTISSSSAARQIVDALECGDAEVVLGPQAKFGALFHGLFPGLTADLFGLVNRFLPGPGGIGKKKVSGLESTSELSPSLLTRLGDEAAVRNNELG
jgi:short-subunit dehydrogenase